MGEISRFLRYAGPLKFAFSTTSPYYLSILREREYKREVYENGPFSGPAYLLGIGE
jgi:hypothetical protein